MGLSAEEWQRKTRSLRSTDVIADERILTDSGGQRGQSSLRREVAGQLADDGFVITVHEWGHEYSNLQVRVRLFRG